MKRALVYEWLLTQAGGEKVLGELLELYPSPLHVLLYDREALKGSPMERAEIRSSFIQSLPFAKTQYRSYLPLFPAAVERFDLSAFDTVLSVSHAVAKGVRTQPGQLHLCYCFTPMRWAWDLRGPYLAGLDPLRRLAARLALARLRAWDSAGAAKVDHFAAISKHSAGRVLRTYGREAEVIYPPVDLERFAPAADREDYFVTVSRLVDYKRVDLIVEAFTRLRLPLVVVGDGPERARLQAMAGLNVRFAGRLEPDAVRETVARARAFVFAAEEDFGIAAVEAQACGVPVIAFGRGGLLETVQDGLGGLFFAEQSAGSLAAAIGRFMRAEAGFRPAAIRESVRRFSAERFRREFSDFVSSREDGHFRAGRLRTQPALAAAGAERR